MQALVLIGGFGTRLRPLTFEVPKQLIPIAGKPLLYHVLDLLPPQVDSAVLATGYKSDVIADHLRRHPPRVPVRCVAEREPLGTGGGMRNAGSGLSDPFVLMNSDVVSEVPVERMLAVHRDHRAFGTMYLSEVEDPEPYGVASLGPVDRIEGFVEKPPRAEAPSKWINAGIAVWDRRVLEAIPPGRPVSFEREILPGLLPRGVYGFRDRGFWEDAGTPDRLLHAQRLLFDAGRGASTAGPRKAIGSGSSVDPEAVGEYVTLGSEVRIGPRARIEDSVIMDGAEIGPGTTIRSSIIGPGVMIGPDRTVERAVLARSRDP